MLFSHKILKTLIYSIFNFPPFKYIYRKMPITYPKEGFTKMKIEIKIQKKIPNFFDSIKI